MVSKEHTPQSVESTQPKRRESFPFLEGVPPEETFVVARKNLRSIFSDKDKRQPKLVDKKGQDLYDTYGRGTCLSVLARVEHISRELKAVLETSDILNPNSTEPVSDETVEEVRRLMLRLTPLGGTASDEVWDEYPKYVKNHDVKQARAYGYRPKRRKKGEYDPGLQTYLYPKWDEPQRGEEGVVPQELNFYHRLLTHVSLAPVFVEKMLTPINEYLEKANREGRQLPDATFGYLKQEDGTYRTIDPNRMKVRMLLHDIGRWATHHQYLHESLPDLIAHHLGIQPPLIKYEFDHELRYLSESTHFVYPQNMPIEEIIFHFIDFISKRADEGDLNSTEIRQLGQLVEHAIVRAVGYNGKLAEYKDFVAGKMEALGLEKTDDLDINLKVAKAMELLGHGSETDYQARFFHREMLFLQLVIPFFDGGTGSGGILKEVGSSLTKIIAEGQKEFEDLLDSGDLLVEKRLDPAERTRQAQMMRSMEATLRGEQTD